jgi:hypothetical protein
MPSRKLSDNNPGKGHLKKQKGKKEKVELLVRIKRDKSLSFSLKVNNTGEQVQPMTQHQSVADSRASAAD